MGPNSPISHGSTLPAIEAASKYMIRMIWKAQTQGYKSFVPTDAAVADFIEYNDTFHKKTVWGSNCKSWFNRGKSHPFRHHVGFSLHRILYRAC